MEWFDFRRDGTALVVLGLSIVMIAAGLSGRAEVFGYAVVLFIGLFAGIGFVRRNDRTTLWPPVVATVVLLTSLAGAFAYQTMPVHSSADAVLGFQPGTAFVIYGIWIPAFFTLGLTFVLLFDRLGTRSPSVSDSQEAP